MRKMYFAMIPKKGFLEQAVTIAAVGLGGFFAYKYLSDKQEFEELTTKVKSTLFDKKAQDEEDLVTRIRNAAKKGVDILKK